jgi:hypothetical protein
LISIYFGRFNTFIWVVSKHSPVAFAMQGVGARTVQEKVQQLRKHWRPWAPALRCSPDLTFRAKHDRTTRVRELSGSSLARAISLISHRNVKLRNVGYCAGLWVKRLSGPIELELPCLSSPKGTVPVVSPNPPFATAGTVLFQCTARPRPKSPFNRFEKNRE